MVNTNTETRTHPSEVELSDLLCGSLSSENREKIEDHIARCDECLEKISSAYESVALFKKKGSKKGGFKNIMKKINLYLVLAIVSFTLSFIVPRYFIQLLVATLLLGIKWVADSKSTKMLIMIYEAWKKGGEKEASRILEKLNPSDKSRF